MWLTSFMDMRLIFIPITILFLAVSYCLLHGLLIVYPWQGFICLGGGKIV